MNKRLTEKELSEEPREKVHGPSEPSDDYLNYPVSQRERQTFTGGRRND